MGGGGRDCHDRNDYNVSGGIDNGKDSQCELQRCPGEIPGEGGGRGECGGFFANRAMTSKVATSAAKTAIGRGHPQAGAAVAAWLASSISPALACPMGWQGADVVPSHHYADRTGCHIYDWSAHRCNTCLVYTGRVTHQTGILQITILVNLQGTIHWGMYESSTTTGHSSLTCGISPTILFWRCQPSGIGDDRERPAGVNLKKISLHLKHFHNIQTQLNYLQF